MPPPSPATFPLIEQFVINGLLLGSHDTPAPQSAEFPLIVQLANVGLLTRQ
jgi:hypothetical protein